jgi:hypothetical protein
VFTFWINWREGEGECGLRAMMTAANGLLKSWILEMSLLPGRLLGVYKIARLSGGLGWEMPRGKKTVRAGSKSVISYSIHRVGPLRLLPPWGAIHRSRCLLFSSTISLVRPSRASREKWLCADLRDAKYSMPRHTRPQPTFRFPTPPFGLGVTHGICPL